MAAAEPTTILLDVSAFTPDLVTVDALAHLQLAARRVGRALRLRNASKELIELITFCGLSEVLGLEPPREPEQREERRGVEEERELPDPPA
jgi:hypothetical protein